LAYNSNVPQDILEKLANDENVTIRRRVARNATSLTLLRRIAKEEKDKDVLVSLAKNPSIPLDVIEILLKRGIISEKYKERLLSNEIVPEELAKSLNALPEELRELSTSKDKYIREKVAKNPNTPKDILEKLSRI
jgi:3-methyladenine DNA glycosylase AlkC